MFPQHDDKDTPHRAYRWAIGWLAACVVMNLAWQITQIATAPMQQLVTWRSIDDTFYYLNTAWHVSRGEGMTFDGIHSTNGVQPLWFGVTVVLAMLTDSKETLYRMSLGTAEIFLSAAMLFVLVRGRRYLGEIGTILLMVAVFLMQTGCLFRIGLEMNLDILLIFMWLMAIGRIIDSQPRAALSLAVVSSLLVLCRIDNLIFAMAGAAVVWSVRRMRRQSCWLDALGVAGVSVATLAVCIVTLFNGRMVPVSGEAKLIFEQYLNVLYGTDGFTTRHAVHLLRSAWSSATLFAWEFFFRSGIVAYFVALGLAAVAIFIAGIKRLHSYIREQKISHREEGYDIVDAIADAGHLLERRPHLVAAAILLLAVAAHFVIDKLTYTYRGKVMLWHNAAEAIVLATLLCAWISAHVRFHPKQSATLFAIVVTILTAAMGYGSAVANRVDVARSDRRQCGFWPDLYAQRYEIAKQLPTMLDPQEPIGVWNAGQIAYFSDMQVVNLDGLVNDTDYLDCLRSRELLPYLRRTGIRHIVDCKVMFWWQLYSDEFLLSDTIHCWPQISPDLPSFSIIRVRDEVLPQIGRVSLNGW